MKMPYFIKMKKTKSPRIQIKVEKWKRYKVIVIRERKSKKLISWARKTKTKEQHLNDFKKFNTLSQKKIKNFQKSKEYKSLGKNTILYTTEDKPIFNKYQVVCSFIFGNRTITGYSDIATNKSQLEKQNLRKQAFQRARSQSIGEGFLKYDYYIEIIGFNRARAEDKNGKTAITFTIVYEYLSYESIKKETNKEY